DQDVAAEEADLRVALAEGLELVQPLDLLALEVAEGPFGVDVQRGREVDAEERYGGMLQQAFLQLRQVVVAHGEAAGVAGAAVALEQAAAVTQAGGDVVLRDGAAAAPALLRALLVDGRGPAVQLHQAGGNEADNALVEALMADEDQGRLRP